MKILLAIILCGISLLWGGIEEPRYSEIRLQGELNFSDIVRETESQLGIKIQLPSKINNNATSNYNHIISLQQLIEAVISRYAQEDIPLDYKFEANMLRFFRLDQSAAKKTPPSSPSKTLSINQPTSPRYPVPTIREPAPEPEDTPRLPNWLEARQSEQKTTISRQEPVISRTNTTSFQDLDDLPTISAHPQVIKSENAESQNSFSVRIPHRPVERSRTEQPKIRPEDNNPAPIKPQQQPYNMNIEPSYSETRTPLEPSYPQSNPVLAPSQHSFGIAPYPEDAVAFINDAPSIVPGASRENYIEWTTRMEGLLKNGHQAALEQERRELEKRLRWLKDHR